MMLSGVGTIGVYNYNTRTGILSSKDDTDEEFIEFFNDELCADDTETMNGYDSRTKAGLKNLLDIWKQFADAGKLMALPEDSEIEISYEITDSVTTAYTINGQKFTNIAAMYYLPEEILEFSKFPEMLQKGYGKTTSNPEGIPDFIYQKALARYETFMEMAINPIHVSKFRKVSTEHYSFVPEPDIGKGGLRILINGESAGVFSVEDLKIRVDEKTGTRVMISEIVGGAWYDAIPVTDELEHGLAEAMGVESIPEEELTGYYIGTHAGTGIQYVMRPGDEGRGGKVLLQTQADVEKYNALAKEYYTKYPNLVSRPEFGRIYASFEICGMMERISTGIVKIGYDNISYNDNFDSKRNWSIMLSEATWELLEEWLRENRSSMKEVQEIQTWKEILEDIGGTYERIWPKERFGKEL
ncbi:MAG: hypothetical protein J6J38_02105 [Lachnospiraceae bacterium]|nr:hypothetical protein [Lachnospiraceae bacterium]